MKDKTAKILFGSISLLLLVSLIIKLTTVPGGLILSGLFLGGIYLLIILTSALLFSLVLKAFIRKYSF